MSADAEQPPPSQRKIGEDVERAPVPTEISGEDGRVELESPLSAMSELESPGRKFMSFRPLSFVHEVEGDTPYGTDEKNVQQDGT